MSAISSLSDRPIVRVLDTCAITIILVSIVVFPLFFLPFSADSMTIPKQLFLFVIDILGLSCWLGRVIVTKEMTIRRTILDVPILLFVTSVVLSSILSLSGEQSFLGVSTTFVLHGTVLMSWILWFALCVQYLGHKGHWRKILHMVLVSGVLASTVFVCRALPFFNTLIAWTGSQTISPFLSLFSIFLSLVVVASLGILLERQRSVWLQLFCLAAMILPLFAIIQLHFTVAWVILIIGFALLTLMGSMFFRDVRLGVLTITFTFFVLSGLYLLFGAPQFFSSQFPLEVALGAPVSWHITLETILQEGKTFLLGTGPGTFGMDFSRFRSAAFNMNTLVWTIRFSHAYNTFFTLLTELGVLGMLFFLLIILLTCGSILQAFFHMRTALRRHSDQNGMLNGDAWRNVYIEIFVLAIVWMCATVGMGLAFYDVTLWWLWWLLLAGLMLGIRVMTSERVDQQSWFFAISPQYTMVLAFGCVLLFTVIGLGVFFVGKSYLAQIYFTRAATVAGTPAEKMYLEKAASFHSTDPLYQIALAQWYFRAASSEDVTHTSTRDAILKNLAEAVNRLRTTSLAAPHRVEVWDALALMYMNVRVVTPEANGWAMESLQKATALEPTNPTFAWCLGSVYEYASDTTNAQTNYHRAIELKPDFAPAYVSLAALYEKEGSTDKSIDVFQPLWPVVEQHPELLYTVGRLVYNRNKAGDDAKAEEMWQRAITLEPNYSNALYSLALLYERRGDRASSERYLQRVALLNPDNDEVRKKLEKFVIPASRALHP